MTARGRWGVETKPFVIIGEHMAAPQAAVV